MAKRIVVAGVGNLLLRDEGVGIHVVNELRKHSLPEYVEVYDFGVRGLGILDSLEGADKAILVDAVKMGDKPGTIYRFSLDEIETEDRILKMISIHDLDLMTAVRIGKFTYKLPKDIVVIGIEPETADEYGMELTPKVKEAVPKVVQAVLDEIKKSG